MYAGLFGCHVAFIMRRSVGATSHSADRGSLRRLCAAVGNDSIKFVSCSATVENPIQHMSTIFGVDKVELVDVDGSPSGRKVRALDPTRLTCQEYVVWNPPYINPEDLTQGRVSTITEASRIFRYLMDRGIRTIVFCKVRASLVVPH